MSLAAISAVMLLLLLADCPVMSQHIDVVGPGMLLAKQPGAAWWTERCYYTTVLSRTEPMAARGTRLLVLAAPSPLKLGKAVVRLLLAAITWTQPVATHRAR